MAEVGSAGHTHTQNVNIKVSEHEVQRGEPSSQTHLSRGAGLPEDSRANQRSAYCKELLMRGRTEFSFEELRAERYNQQKEEQLDEKLRCLSELKEQLSVELEEKKKLLLLRRSQQQGDPECSASFQIFDDSQSAAVAAWPAGDELPDDVFLRPDERGLCLKTRCPRPGAGAPSGLSQTEDVIQSGVQDENLSTPSPGLHRVAAEDLRTAKVSWPPIVSQKPVSRLSKKLSPIQETSSLTLLGGCSPLEEEPPSAGGAVDPCDPDWRRQLLDLCDVTSGPDFHSEPHPLPMVEEHCGLQLGGELFHVYCRVLDGGRFSVYAGAAEEKHLLIKVDSCSVPWDFHQFQRLKTSLSSTDGLPSISCFLFLDGCITVYATPPDHMFTDLVDCVSSEAVAGRKAVSLLTLLSQLWSCRLLHGGLQTHVLTCCHRGFLSPDWVFPVDWSSSLDLDLQQDITSVQQVPSAQTYIGLGLLEPNGPPQLVDLVGVAETVHLLLTNSRMVLVKDDGGWTAEQFSGDEPCDMFSRMWRRFFRSLLNADGRWMSSVLELREQLSALYH